MGISLGLVGLGAFGSSFARLFKSHPLVDRVGLCDLEPERISRFADDPSFGDFVAGGFWNVIGLLLNMPTYSFWPGPYLT